MPRRHRNDPSKGDTGPSTDAAVAGEKDQHTQMVSNQVMAIAAAGLEQPDESFPFLDAIQASFGDYDVGGLKAHTDPETAGQIGANAYTLGKDAVFGESPGLKTAAEEATHALLQGGGIGPGGVGQEGDPYERHADQVADRVAKGESAMDLLDSMTGGDRSITPGGVAGLQREAARTPAAKDSKPATGKVDIDFNNLDSSVAGLIENLAGGNKAGTSRTLSMSLGVNAGLSKWLEVGASIGFTGKMFTDDDLMFRTALTLSLRLEAEVEAWFIKIGAGATLSRTFTNVWDSPRHFAVQMAAYLNEVLSALREVDEASAGGEKDAGLSEDEKAKRLADQRLASRKPGSVKSTTYGVDAEVELPGDRKGKAAMSRTTSVFERNSDGKVRVGTTDVQSIGLEFGPNLEASVDWTQVENHAIPDNNGDYLTVNVKQKAGVPGVFHRESWEGLVGALGALQSLQVTSATQIKSTLKGAWDKATKASNFKPGDGESGTSAESKAGLGVTWHMVDTDGTDAWAFKTQYARLVGSMKQEYGAKSVGTVSVEGKVGLEGENTLLEKAGAGTSTYFQTHYNGLRRKDPKYDDPKFDPKNEVDYKPPGWDEYVSSNQGSLWSMFANLALQQDKGEGNLLSELGKATDLLGKVKQHAGSLYDKSAEPLPGTPDVARAKAFDGKVFSELMKALNSHFNSTEMRATTGWEDPKDIVTQKLEAHAFTMDLGKPSFKGICWGSQAVADGEYKTVAAILSVKGRVSWKPSMIGGGFHSMLTDASQVEDIARLTFQDDAYLRAFLDMPDFAQDAKLIQEARNARRRGMPFDDAEAKAAEKRMASKLGAMILQAPIPGNVGYKPW